MTESGPAFLQTDAKTFLSHAELGEELFGPSSIFVRCSSKEDLERVARSMAGNLTATLLGTPEDLTAHRDLIALLEMKVGRLIINGYPTGVEVCHAMQHGGPYPATTDSRFTSVGAAAIERFARPVCYQGFPDALLPPELQDANPRGILRIVEGEATRDSLK
jgi:NADP-dependent aldehyde dehydrogenase